MPTTGPTICGTGADGGNGLQAWTNPGNITANDGSFASSVVTSVHPLTNEILATKFNFTIPLTATINGIQVDFSRKIGVSVAKSCQDNDVTLLKAGVTTGNNKAVVGNWPSAFTLASYGNSSDLWGASWLPSDINDINFGVQISVAWVSGTNAVPEIDYVQITITYTSPSSGDYLLGGKHRDSRFILPGRGIDA